MDFNESHKEEMSNRLPFGVHKVQIIGFNLDKTDSDKEYLEVGFVTEDGEHEDKARIWFTTDLSAKFSFNTIRTILIHNTKEADREKAAKAIDAVVNTEELASLAAKHLHGKEMWVTKYLDPKRTYEKNGQTFRSINVNIYGYEPKLNPELMPKKESASQAAKAVFNENQPPFNDDGSDPEKGNDEGWA